MDIYAVITDRIIAQLEKGTIPWKKPWIGVGNSGAVSYSTGKPYSLLNQMLLEEPGEYITFKQVQQAGGKVKKGAKSKMVVFWKMQEKPLKDKAGNDVLDNEGKQVMKSIPYLQYFNVFHISDCEGIEPKHAISLPEKFEPDAKANRIITEYLARSGVSLVHQEGDRAFYRPADDKIVLPLMKQFVAIAEYYSTAFHEMVHSTGHKSRLNRFDGEEGDTRQIAYSKEELVAEIGSASLMSMFGMETKESFDNSAAYIKSWLKALRDDKRMIVSAAGRAEKAAQMIVG